MRVTKSLLLEHCNNVSKGNRQFLSGSSGPLRFLIPLPRTARKAGWDGFNKKIH
jgi:hypothetical protein